MLSSLPFTAHLSKVENLVSVVVCQVSIFAPKKPESGIVDWR